MYLNHDEILELCEAGYMENWDKDCINAASLDVRLGKEILCEQGTNAHKMIDYSKRQKPDMQAVILDKGGIALYPGQFFLAHTMERCNLPDDIACLFRIKSSMGRIGLEHMDAGWVDPGFNGALTLEFKLMMERHWVNIKPADRIGQLIFFRGNMVSEDKSYRTKGNYNGASGVKQVGYEK
jgi:dCTP deaminase